MILNLNQVTFADFGTVLPQREPDERFSEREGDRSTLSLTNTTLRLFRANADTWLRCASGTAVISASADGEAFRDYYLDKTVCVKAGVTFSLSAFWMRLLRI